jgi:hypothetical protein
MNNSDLITNKQNQDDVHIFVQIETLLGISHWLEFLTPQDDFAKKMFTSGMANLINEKFKEQAHTRLVQLASIKDDKFEAEVMDAAETYLCGRPEISAIYDELQGDSKVLSAMIRRDDESLTEIRCLDNETFEQMKVTVNTQSFDVADYHPVDSKKLGFFVEYGKDDGGFGCISYEVEMYEMKLPIEFIKQMTRKKKMREIKKAHSELAVLFATEESETTEESFSRMTQLATTCFLLFDGAEEVIRHYSNIGGGVSWFFDKKQIGLNNLKTTDYDSFKIEHEEIYAEN